MSATLVAVCWESPARSLADEASVDECHRAIRHCMRLNTPREWHVLLLGRGDEKEEPMESTTQSPPLELSNNGALNELGLGSGGAVLHILKLILEGSPLP